jgi:hypothetical protein
VKDALIIGLAAVAVYAVWRYSQPTRSGVPTGTPANSSQQQSLGTSLENVVQSRTGVPIAAIGNLAQSAPTWVKVAVFPVGVTAVAQGVITHPVDTAKKIGSAASSAYNATLGRLF